MHALPVNLPCVKQLPVITNEAGASLHAGSTCAIGVVTVRPFNRQPAQLYFKLTPNPNNTFFFIFTCTTQYPWVLANPDLSQAMASSKQKRTHTVFRASSTHRSASTSKPRFVGEKVKLGELISKAKVERCGNRSFPVYSMTMHDGIVEQSGRFKKTIASKDTSSYKVVKKNQLVVGFPIDEGVIYVQNHDQPGIMSPAYNVWDFDSDRILPAYLEFALHSPQSMAYYAEKMRGTTARRRTLTGDALKNMSVPVPSIEDQYAVVKTLNCIKSQLAATQQMLDKLDHLVKSRFVEMFGSSSADSRYEVCRIGDIADVFVGVVVKPKQYYTDDHANGIKAFRSLNVGEMQVRDDDWVYFSKEGNKKAKKTQLHAGDVLVVRSGYPGTSCVVPLLYEGCNAVDLIIARSNSNNVLPEYIAAFNNGSHMKSLINQMSVGSAQKHFNIGFYRNVEIPLPPLSAQKEYVSFLRQVNKSRFVRDHEINFR